MGGAVVVSHAALTQEFFLASSLGLSRVSAANVKFGYAPELANGNVATVWAGTKASVGQLLYLFPDDAGETIEIVSSVAGDTAIGIQLEGLDVAGAPQTEVVVLDGADSTTPVASLNTWRSVDRAFVVGTTPVVGEIQVYGDGTTSANVFAVILPADQQTVQAAAMVPADKVMVVVNWATAINKAGAQSASAVLKLVGKRIDGVQRTAKRYGLTLDGTSNVSKDLVVPSLFPPLCQVSVVTDFTTTAGAGDISAEFTYILVDSDAISADVLAGL